MDNLNHPDYLSRTKNAVIENIRRTAATGVQMTDVPRHSLLPGMDSDAEDEEDDLDADNNPDVRKTRRQKDKSIIRDDEFEHSDDDDMDELRYQIRERVSINTTNAHAASPGPGDPGHDEDMSGATGPATTVALGAPSSPVLPATGTAQSQAGHSQNRRPQLWSAGGGVAGGEQAEAEAEEEDEMDVDDEEDKDEDDEKEKEEEEGDMEVEESIRPTIENEDEDKS
jgi:histone deacetylase 1/2